MRKNPANSLPKIITRYSGVLALALMLLLISPGISLAANQPRSYQQDTDFILVADEAAEALGWSERSGDISDYGAAASIEHSVEVGTCQNYDSVTPNTEVDRILIIVKGSPEEAEQSASHYGSETPVSPEAFHGLNGYRVSPDAARMSFSWAMGNVRLTAGNQFYCSPKGQALDPMPIAEAMYAAAVRHGLGANPINPNPPNPNPPAPNPPEPNPPGPDQLDVQILVDQISQLVNNPAVPVSGAVAGTLLALLIAALRGGTPIPVRNLPPAGARAPKPGDVDARGRVYSPVSGGGWVSRQMYDYQKNWLGKGWKWNANTGRFEGQHGAINEKGQVLDNDLGWVDQKVFNENERMRARGLVYDRNLGFRSPDELNQSRSNQDAIRQRSREFSAVKNAEIQRELALEQRARDEAWKKWEQDLAKKEQIRQQMEAQQDNVREQVRKAYYYDGLSKTVKGVEIAADVAISVAAQYTGPVGKTIEKAYFEIKDVAAAADTAYEKKSLKAGLDEYIDSKKPGLKDNIFKLVPKSIKKGVMKSVKNVILNPTNRKAFYAGVEKLKDQAVDYVSEAASEELDQLKEGYLNKNSQELMDGLERPIMDGQGKLNFPDKNVDEKTYQDGIKAIGLDPSIFTGGNPPSTPGI